MAAKKSAPIEELDEVIVDEVIVEEDIVEEDVIEAEPVSVVNTDEGPAFIRAIGADNYLSLAERISREGDSVREVARKLAELNGNAVVRPGARIRIR